MDRTSIRAWRRIQKKRVWRNRLRLIYRAFSTVYLEDSATGEKREAKTWKELRKVKWCQAYRTTSQPCSCMMCKGERYNRLDFKRESIKLINNALEMD